MTAFKNLPAWQDFVRGRESDMLRMRLAFTTEKLDKMHTETLARHSSMKNHVDEMTAYEQWCLAQASSGKRRKKAGPLMPCPCCDTRL